MVKKVGAMLVVFAVFSFAVPLFFTETVRAADDDQYIWGMIFDSDGLLLSYDTNFRVWVQHNATWKGFPSNTTWDPVGTMGGFYSYTLPWDQRETNWTDGDLYRIQVDCTPSGDLAQNATSNGTGSAGDPVSPRGSYNNEMNWVSGGGFNNSQQWDVVCSSVDLIPTDIRINGVPYFPPMAVASFSTATISSNIANVGRPLISEPNTIVLGNASGVIGQDTASTIDAGSSVGPFNFSWTAPSAGHFFFNITVDYYDNVTETNEINNRVTIELDVLPGPITSLLPRDPYHYKGPDLYIKSTTPLGLVISHVADWAHVLYYVDSLGPWNYSETGQFTIAGEGVHYINFSSFDSLGNLEDMNVRQVIVDDSPPIATLSVTEPKYVSGGIAWIKSLDPATPIYIEWIRDDEPELAVGRERTSYRVFQLVFDWGPWTDYSQGDLVGLGTTDGLRFIEWYSVDFLGNAEITNNRTVYVDDTAPQAQVHIGEPRLDRDGIPYVELETEFELSADDRGGCGVEVIEYRLDDETDWRTYTGPFRFDSVGGHTIYYRSTDNLNNTGEPQSLGIVVYGSNYKPWIAVIFMIIVMMIGAVVGYKRPLLMARKKIREVEETLLEKEKEMEMEEVVGDGIAESPPETEESERVKEVV